MHTPDNNLAARVFISTTSLRRFVDIIPHPDTLGFLRATGGWGARMHVDTRVRAPGGQFPDSSAILACVVYFLMRASL